MKYKDNWKHLKKSDVSQSDIRSKRRLEESQLNKFKLKEVSDKIWFESLTHSIQLKIMDSFYFHTWSPSSKKTESFFLDNFWEKTKKNYPGDLSKQRDAKLEILLK